MSYAPSAPTIESSSSHSPSPVLPSPVSPVSVSSSSASTCDPLWTVLSVVGSVVCERHGGYQTGVAIDPEVEEFAPRAPLLFPVGTLFPLPQGCWFGYRRRRGCRFNTSKVRLEALLGLPLRLAGSYFNTSKVRLEGRAPSPAPSATSNFNTSKVRLEV